VIRHDAAIAASAVLSTNRWLFSGMLLLPGAIAVKPAPTLLIRAEWDADLPT
jgi:hypothetical protein